MIREVKEARPKAGLVLIEPFLFKMDRERVPGNEDIVDNWGRWSTYTETMRGEFSK